ncbi:aconitate hydratase AcnA [Paracoccus onubensis]|uniref:aconitate hydratase n=1 Tax=Paracoccus onubensis TaxID=1675788 RepID=UPI0027317CB6|nr:aconitate hydratase AcnA [Paracoccus onubensis]MDP0926191.1 aconitate hydratase AcnA [Paracoccus onubensis]
MQDCASPELLRPLGGGTPGNHYLSLAAAEARYGPLCHLPRSLLVLAEDILWRKRGDAARTELDALRAAVTGDMDGAPISFAPGRALFQDFLGIPLMTDLASMRDVLAHAGAEPHRLEPRIPVDFVVDHSLSVEIAGRLDALFRNREIEFQRNTERFEFIKWCENAFETVRVIPPGRGIMHQVNIEWLSTVIRDTRVAGRRVLRPDTMIGTDSHTTMVNALGILGWGVGGIEAEAAILGLPLGLEAPRVVGLELRGVLPPGAAATDLVLHITAFLRQIGVVGAFVEMHGRGLAGLSLATRATIANMAPEYGATCCYFPIDRATIAYLAMTGRSGDHLAEIENYARVQGLWSETGEAATGLTENHVFDLATVEPVMAGPSRPEQRVTLGQVPASFDARLAALKVDEPAASGTFGHGAIVIAAITSCTNTANPMLMITAGMLARNAAARGLTPKPWVKCSMAPGSRAVTDYLDAAGLTPALEALGFHTVGYGCTTCNGNSGPLDPEWQRQITQNNLATVAVLSGNRNFEGRIHPSVKAAYLASPALVIAAAIAGSISVDLSRDPLGVDAKGRPVHLDEILPDPDEVEDAVRRFVTAGRFRDTYSSGQMTTEDWRLLPAPATARFPWKDDSLFIRSSDFPKLPPAFDPQTGAAGMRPLLVLGDGITTDHISPNGAIRPGTPAAEWLTERGATRPGNYGLRRGNPEICARGMFDNPLLENALAGGLRGNLAPAASGEPVPVWTAAQERVARGESSVIVAGRNYGAGSSRDWAAKGLRMLGVVMVLAESFERIHRSNLVGMGVLPLTFASGWNAARIALTGTELFDILPEAMFAPRCRMRLRIRREQGTGQESEILFPVRLDVQSESEIETLRAGGILPQILGRLLDDAA